eukprot:2732354-Amphidinium_carterae.1
MFAIEPSWFCCHRLPWTVQAKSPKVPARDLGVFRAGLVTSCSNPRLLQHHARQLRRHGEQRLREEIQELLTKKCAAHLMCATGWDLAASGYCCSLAGGQRSSQRANSSSCRYCFATSADTSLEKAKATHNVLSLSDWSSHAYMRICCFACAWHRVCCWLGVSAHAGNIVGL